MAHIIEETLKKMHKDSAEQAQRETLLYGGFKHPKCKHKFSVQVDNPTLTEDEKIIFANQVIEAYIQESTLLNSNIFTVVLEDDICNNVVEMLYKLNKCNFIVTYLDGTTVATAVTHLRECQLLMNRSHVSYAESATHKFKLIYSFDTIERTVLNLEPVVHQI
jgi:hypothetical protein